MLVCSVNAFHMGQWPYLVLPTVGNVVLSTCGKACPSELASRQATHCLHEAGTCIITGLQHP